MKRILPIFFFSTVAVWLSFGLYAHSDPAKPGKENPRLQGSWLVDASVTGDPQQIHALLTCLPSGEVIETPSVLLPVSTGHGAWIQTGKNEFAITVVYLRRDDNGDFIGTSKVRSVFTVNDSLTTGGGRFETEVFDPAGNMVGSFAGFAQAKRIEAERLP